MELSLLEASAEAAKRQEQRLDDAKRKMEAELPDRSVVDDSE